MADPVARSIRGFWPDAIRAHINGVERRFLPPLGAGVGGSSVFYAATLERPEPHDLDHSTARPHPTGGWPVSFADMLPWFDAAQAMYHVHGQPDPLSEVPSPNVATPPSLSPGDTAITELLRGNGLHPYRLHSALKYLEGCTECLGVKCPRACKMDGRSAGVEPALATGKAALLDRCEVTALHASDGRITGIEATRDGVSLRLSADQVVLAAGALSSPRLLLASTSDDWPNGIGNRGDQVGRNLMFHLNELVALWPGKGAGFEGPSKAVGFRDLYFADGKRLGMVQAMGVDVGYGEIVHHLRTRLDRSALRRVPGLADLTRIPAAIGARILGTAKVFVGLLEDLPYGENRVQCDPDRPGGILITYQIAPELLTRRKLFRKRIKRAFRGSRFGVPEL